MDFFKHKNRAYGYPKHKLLILVFFLSIFQGVSYAQIPKPAHVVIVILENRAYNQIIGSSAAPFINSLVKSKDGALFTNFHAITHPSQPNYLALFSGSVQGIKNDGKPKNLPFTTPNLGNELLEKGYTFAGYSEDLPGVGFAGVSSGLYVRKHNPWVNWQDSKKNGLPDRVNLPLTRFPKNYKFLPVVSFVIPNLDNDMHNGSIKRGDKWIREHLKGYIEWAKKHNSLFILTFDEDNFTPVNKIPTLLVGEMVKQGRYSRRLNHYNLLRTIEEMYGLAHAGISADSSAISGCWKTIRRL